MSMQQVAKSPAPVAGAGGAEVRKGAERTMQFLLRYGVFAVFVIMLLIFSVLRPGTFLQIDTLRAILVDAAVLGVVASALTLVLAIGEFDLSFGNVAGVAGAIAVYSMYMLGLPVPIAILLALLAGLAAGAISGMIVAYGKVPALIATLAVGSMALGLERAIMNDNTVYDGIPPGYVALTETSFAGVPLIVIISILAVIALSLVSSFTVFGRRIYAIGGSDEAARIAGIRTKQVRWLTFVVMGLTAAFAGILLTSQAGSYYPNSGVGLLLPAFAACFLGWSAAGANRFYPAYTYFGVLFMGTLSTGLIMLQVPSWVDNFVQGAVLVSAVLVARAARTR
ncbi:putative Ribose transport system permease protein RbsC [Mesorhizobium plurifarium]|uniref:Putative Ribose transport system permease protein RbsC n=1 Tax=Mesorhizobium plurifarium TaxID=69974 RepID=A0A0K2W0Q9_MESPL|nr:putative Ribose transport system permease protein RbsC [Mesorhizobium plurifarium]